MGVWSVRPNQASKGGHEVHHYMAYDLPAYPTTVGVLAGVVLAFLAGNAIRVLVGEARARFDYITRGSNDRSN